MKKWSKKIKIPDIHHLQFQYDCTIHYHFMKRIRRDIVPKFPKSCNAGISPPFKRACVGLFEYRKKGEREGSRLKVRSSVRNFAKNKSRFQQCFL